MNDIELIATKLLGPWDETRCRVCGWPLDKDGQFCRITRGSPDCSLRPPPSRRADSPPDFTTLDGCRLFEDALYASGRLDAYIGALCDSIDPDGDAPSRLSPLQQAQICILATPAQRVAACVQVIRKAGL